jgi:hypothetical protein
MVPLYRDTRTHETAWNPAAEMILPLWHHHIGWMRMLMVPPYCDTRTNEIYRDPASEMIISLWHYCIGRMRSLLAPLHYDTHTYEVSMKPRRQNNGLSLASLYWHSAEVDGTTMLRYAHQRGSMISYCRNDHLSLALQYLQDAELAGTTIKFPHPRQPRQTAATRLPMRLVAYAGRKTHARTPPDLENHSDSRSPFLSRQGERESGIEGRVPADSWR